MQFLLLCVFLRFLWLMDVDAENRLRSQHLSQVNTEATSTGGWLPDAVYSNCRKPTWGLVKFASESAWQFTRERSEFTRFEWTRRRDTFQTTTVVKDNQRDTNRTEPSEARSKLHVTANRPLTGRSPVCFCTVEMSRNL